MRTVWLCLTLVSLLSAALAENLHRQRQHFQYSSSSKKFVNDELAENDEKSGFYRKQTGNMGGNYEQEHNMDAVAQSQMDALMRQSQSLHGAALGSGIHTTGVGSVDLGQQTETAGWTSGLQPLSQQADTSAQRTQALRYQSNSYGGHVHSQNLEDCEHGTLLGQQALETDAFSHSSRNQQSIHTDDVDVGQQTQNADLFGVNKESDLGQHMEAVDQTGSVSANAQSSYNRRSYTPVYVPVVRRAQTTQMYVLSGGTQLSGNPASGTQYPTGHQAANIDREQHRTELSSAATDSQQSRYGQSVIRPLNPHDLRSQYQPSRHFGSETASVYSSQEGQVDTQRLQSPYRPVSVDETRSSQSDSVVHQHAITSNPTEPTINTGRNQYSRNQDVATDDDLQQSRQPVYYPQHTSRDTVSTSQQSENFNSQSHLVPVRRVSSTRPQPLDTSTSYRGQVDIEHDTTASRAPVSTNIIQTSQRQHNQIESMSQVKPLVHHTTPTRTESVHQPSGLVPTSSDVTYSGQSEVQELDQHMETLDQHMKDLLKLTHQPASPVYTYRTTVRPAYFNDHHYQQQSVQQKAESQNIELGYNQHGEDLGQQRQSAVFSQHASGNVEADQRVDDLGQQTLTDSGAYSHTADQRYNHRIDSASSYDDIHQTTQDSQISQRPDQLTVQGLHHPSTSHAGSRYVPTSHNVHSGYGRTASSSSIASYQGADYQPSSVSSYGAQNRLPSAVRGADRISYDSNVQETQKAVLGESSEHLTAVDENTPEGRYTQQSRDRSRQSYNHNASGRFYGGGGGDENDQQRLSQPGFGDGQFTAQSNGQLEEDKQKTETIGQHADKIVFNSQSSYGRQEAHSEKSSYEMIAPTGGTKLEDMSPEEQQSFWQRFRNRAKNVAGQVFG